MRLSIRAVANNRRLLGQFTSYPGDICEEKRLYGELFTRVRLNYILENDDTFRYVDFGTNTLEIRPIPEKGFGLFTKRKIDIGEMILVEKPLVTFPRKDGKNHSILPYFSALSSADQVSYIGLSDSYHYMTTSKTLEGIKINNALGLSPTSSRDTTCGIFLISNRINHSCTPNAIFSYNSSTERGAIYAIDSISVDDEITLSYFKGDVLSRQLRHDFLLSYGIHPCECPLCKRCAESELFECESDSRRSEIVSLQGAIVEQAILLRQVRERRSAYQTHHAATHDMQTPGAPLLPPYPPALSDQALSLGVRDSLSSSSRLLSLLQSEGLSTHDNMNWYYIFLFWITDDAAYACLSYLCTVSYKGEDNSQGAYMGIPVHARGSRALPAHFLSGEKCSFQEFQGLRCKFDIPTQESVGHVVVQE
jgi:hypothetical protein